ncbi:MAG: hypothetical protein HY606_04765 [Planctomycetes bacterium]|nr:hypothetical protein [Planctomycetota bacterium]
MKLFKVSVFSPLKKAFESDSVTSLVVPSYEGKLGILANHAEIICKLVEGEIKVDLEGQKSTFLKINNGILYCKNNCVTVLVKQAAYV